MNEKYENNKRFFSCVKRIKGGVFSLNLDNALFGMKHPKIIFSIVQPAPEDAQQKYTVAKFFADVADVQNIYNRILRQRGDGELFKVYKGGWNEKRNCVEARIMSITVKKRGDGSEIFAFQIENCEGETKKVANGNGEMVDGVVKPKSGGKTFSKNTFGISKDEALQIAESLRMELQAWRTVEASKFSREARMRQEQGGRQYGSQRQEQDGESSDSQPPTVQHNYAVA